MDVLTQAIIGAAIEVPHILRRALWESHLGDVGVLCGKSWNK